VEWAGIEDLGPEEREASMASVIAIGIFAFFAVGAMVGFLAMVAIAVRREERGLTLTSKASDRVVLGARRVNGVYRRDLDDDLEAWSRELVH
jgi:hypothetical protein